ncbi:MAG: hypothetical protein AAB336_03745 [Acidobacteriota bacterium]
MKTSNFFNATKRTFLTLTAILTIFAGLTLADDITLDMEGTTATIPKGNTITRKIYGIPKFGGTLKIKYKWHAVSIIPNTFNALKVVVKHGSTVINTKNSCYSTHSNKTPKCDLFITVSENEAEKSGNWTIEVTNNSGDEVIGFDIRKGSDINPAVPNFKSVYSPNCPDSVNLDLEGADTTTITKGGTATRKIFGIGKSAGVLRLRAKWHAVHIVPNTFNGLKIELLKPDGTVALSGTYFSFHSNKTPKFDITYNMSQADAEKPGSWSLRITNNSAYEAIGFNIVKGSDINPLVPSFNSTYKATCE